MNTIKNYVVTFLYLITLTFTVWASTSSKTTPRTHARRISLSQAPVKTKSSPSSTTRHRTLSTKVTSALKKVATKITAAKASVRRPSRSSGSRRSSISTVVQPQPESEPTPESEPAVLPEDLATHKGRVLFIPVEPQRGLDCAYRALTNVYRDFQKLRYDVETEVPTLSDMRERVIERRLKMAHEGKERLDALRAKSVEIKKQDTVDQEKQTKEHDVLLRGDNLTEGELEYLRDTFGFERECFTIIPSITMYAYNAAYREIIDIKEEIMNATKKLLAEGALHGFIINNATEKEDYKTSGGHWVTIIACRKNGQLHYRVMDSLNRQPINTVRALQIILEDPDPMPEEVTLQQRFKDALQRKAAERKKGVARMKNALSNASRRARTRAVAALNRVRRRH